LLELLKHGSILGKVSVGGHSFRHFIGGSADDTDGYLREAFAHNAKKLKPRHMRHVEVGNNYVWESLAKFSECVQTVNRRPNDIPRSRQMLRGQLSDRRFVVD